jgi:hypothetical protein
VREDVKESLAQFWSEPNKYFVSLCNSPERWRAPAVYVGLFFL